MAQTIKVKPLIWRKDDMSNGRTAWWGTSPGGRSSVFLVLGAPKSPYHYCGAGTNFATLEEAQAAAQVDHARITFADIELVDEEPDTTTDAERVLQSVGKPDLLTAARSVLQSWDDRMGGARERQITTTIAGGIGDHTFWSPATSSVSSASMAKLREALAELSGEEAR